jgi:hypothetical protein
MSIIPNAPFAICGLPSSAEFSRWTIMNEVTE